MLRRSPTVAAGGASRGVHDRTQEAARVVRRLWLAGWIVLGVGAAAHGEAVDAVWKMFHRGERSQRPPDSVPGEAKDAHVHDKWKSDNGYWWFVADLKIPETIDGKPTQGQPVGLMLSCAAGGDVFVADTLQTRYDNDHPALVLLADPAEPGRAVHVAVQAYPKVGGDGEYDFGQADWVLIDTKRVREPVRLRVDARKELDPMPDGLIGLSQGGGMADYEDATAAKLREAGFKWFRMDNVFTQAVKEDKDAKSDADAYVYDFSDLEKRVQFMKKIGAEPILCVSYMPQAFDAIPDPERHSAPKDYKLWEELCYRAAKYLMDRGLHCHWWEVWNETNSGWLKPGPNDKGTEEFRKLYAEALGEPPKNDDDVRLLEAYLKLYEATVKGVRRADPEAKIGGPCLASGPYEQSEHGHAVRGKALTRGLMLYCDRKKLPLDFISWHEYFHPADLFVDETKTFHRFLDEFPSLRRQVKSYMITEWNASWWADQVMDNEIGTAWCADVMIRAIVPEKVDRPCFFYVKDNDDNLRGGFALIIRDNVPKPQYHMAKMFNEMTGRQLAVSGGDGDVCALASWDAKQERLSVIVVNYSYRFGLGRKVVLTIGPLPAPLAKGVWERQLIDATHSNVWNDKSHANLETVDRGTVSGRELSLEMTLEANTVTRIEITAKKKP